MPGPLSPISYEPIVAVRTAASAAAFPAMGRHPEAATQTFNKGVPVMLDGAGNLIEWSSAAPNTVYGTNAEPPHNLTVAATAQNLSEGTPQNQPSGITTPVGAWPRDGKLEFYQANGLSVFSVAIKVGQVFTQAMIQAGVYYGLVKDATSKFWYLDNTITNGNAAVAQVLGMDPTSANDGVNGTRLFFVFAPTRRFFA